MHISESDFKKSDWEFINSKNFNYDIEYIYHTETLYKNSNNEFALHIMWMVSPLWAKEYMEDEEMSEDELEPKEVYLLIPESEALEWLEGVSECEPDDFGPEDLNEIII